MIFNGGGFMSVNLVDPFLVLFIFILAGLLSFIITPLRSFFPFFPFSLLFHSLHYYTPGYCTEYYTHAITKMADAQIIPAMSPPPGKTSNFVDPEYQGTKFIVVNCIFLPLAVLALAVRTWTRVCIVRNFQADDCTFYLVSGI